MTPSRQPDHTVPEPPLGALAEIRWWPFIILGSAGAVVLLSGRRGLSLMGPVAMVWVPILVVGLALAVFLEVVARTCVSRQRLAAGFDASPEAARLILDASAGLTRVVNLGLAAFMALLVVPQRWLPGLGRGRALALGMAILLAAVVWSVWALKSVHRRLERAGQLGGLEGWNGFIYCNAEDPRLWVPKLAGFGMTLNFAHGRAWLILGGILALPLGGVVFALVSALCR